MPHIAGYAPDRGQVAGPIQPTPGLQPKPPLTDKHAMVRTSSGSRSPRTS